MTEHNFPETMSAIYVCMNLPATRQKRACKTTGRQYEVMVDFLSQNIEMVRGKITPSFTAERKRMLWQKLADTLNEAASLYGPKKDVWKWRKTWMDIKSDVKRKARALKRQLSLPDDCPEKKQPVDQLSSLEEKILKIIETASNMQDDDDYINVNQVLPSESVVLAQVPTEKILLPHLSNERIVLPQIVQLKAIEPPVSQAEKVVNSDFAVVPLIEKAQIKVEPCSEEDELLIQLPCTTSSEPGTQVENHDAEMPCSTSGANTQGESCSSDQSEQPRITSTLSESAAENSAAIPETSVREDISNDDRESDKSEPKELHSTLFRTNKLLERLVTATEERNRIEQKRNDILFSLLQKVFR